MKRHRHLYILIDTDKMRGRLIRQVHVCTCGKKKRRWQYLRGL